MDIGLCGGGGIQEMPCFNYNLYFGSPLHHAVHSLTSGEQDDPKQQINNTFQHDPPREVATELGIAVSSEGLAFKRLSLEIFKKKTEMLPFL